MKEGSHDRRGLALAGGNFPNGEVPASATSTPARSS
jgi:hypothetical protein